jgi:NADH-quinone oxidoreductase subunit A
VTYHDNNLLAFILLMLATAGLVGMFVALSKFIGPKKQSAAKDYPFESGILVDDQANRPFPIKYYLVALLFIVFDIEIAFMYPWAVTFRGLGMVGLVSMVIFIVVLLVGLWYAVKKRVLEWK